MDAYRAVVKVHKDVLDACFSQLAVPLVHTTHKPSISQKHSIETARSDRESGSDYVRACSI
jgi:hypothetical protein